MTPETERADHLSQAKRDRSCAERLPEQLAGRLEDFRAMLARDDPDEPTEAEYDAAGVGPLSEYPLGASVRFALRVELSTGGPADYLTATIDTDGDIERIVYHFADWFDHAERALADAEFATASDFINALYGGELAYSLGLMLAESAT